MMGRATRHVVPPIRKIKLDRVYAQPWGPLYPRERKSASTNWAEEYFSRLRRAEISIYHHIAGAHLLGYAQGSSWREDNSRVSNGDQVNRIAAMA
jgi:ISXO2-like transposase domain